MRPHSSNSMVAIMQTADTPYQLLGEEAIRQLCREFYRIMDTRSEVRGAQSGAAQSGSRQPQHHRRGLNL